MKKVLSLVLAIMMVLCSVSALAASPDAGNHNGVVPVVPAVTEEVEEEAVVEMVADAEEVAELVGEMEAAEYDAAVYTEDTQAAIAALLPEGVAIEELVANEVIAIKFVAEVEADMAMTFEFTTAYTQDQAVVGVVKAAEAETVLPCEVNEDGTVTMVFSKELVASLVDTVATLAILSK